MTERSPWSVLTERQAGVTRAFLAARSTALPAEPAPGAVAALDGWLREVRKRSW